MRPAEWKGPVCRWYSSAGAMTARRGVVLEFLRLAVEELAGSVAVAAGLNLADGVAGIGAGTWTVGLERCCRVCFSSAVRSRRGELPRPENYLRPRMEDEAACDPRKRRGIGGLSPMKEDACLLRFMQFIA